MKSKYRIPKAVADVLQIGLIKCISAGSSMRQRIG